MKRKKLIFLIIVLVIIALSFFIWWNSQVKIDNAQNDSDNQNATSASLKINKSKTENSKTETPEAIITVERKLPPIPDLEKPINVMAELRDVDRDNALDAIKKLREDLKEDNDLYDSWMELALQMKLIGDYKEAEKIWIYAAAKWEDATPVSNLSNLYIYQFNDLKKGEEYLLQAIERAPHLSFYYYNAYEFYRFIKKQPEKAKEILRKGIAVQNIDNSKYLSETLNSF